MNKQLVGIIFLSLTMSTTPGWAQDSTVSVKSKEMPERLLPYANPMESSPIQEGLTETPTLNSLDNFQKDVITRSGKIFQ